MADRPVKTIKNLACMDGVEVAIFTNDKGYSLSIQHSYKTQTGEWKHAKSFFPKSIPGLIIALHEAHSWIQRAYEAKRNPEPDLTPAVAEDSSDGGEELPF
jgi:hypothetical protein